MSIDQERPTLGESKKSLMQSSVLDGVAGVLRNLSMIQGHFTPDDINNLADGFANLAERLRDQQKPLPEVSISPKHRAAVINTKDLGIK